MPLKIVSRPGTKTLYVRGTVGGQSIFESTGSADAKRAEAYRAKRDRELWQESVFGKRSVISFAHAVAAYGEAEERSDRTKDYLTRLLTAIGSTRVSDINQETLDGLYRKVLRDGNEASAATKIRSVLTPLRAVLEFAALRQWCDRPALKGPTVAKTQAIFLRPEEASRLVQAAAAHVRPLLIFLIGTGCRMSEAIELDWSRVDLRGSQAVVWQKQGNERHIELVPRVVSALSSLGHRDGAVFRPPVRGGKQPDAYADKGRDSGGHIKSAWSVACRDAGLPGEARIWTPKGQARERRFFVPEATPHDLRHTWATWHYCVHKDLIGLKDEGGWSTINMVTRYAKKMPDAYRTEILEWWGNRPDSLGG